jgi:formate-dependent nitrite reductase membrane component NrfD
MHPDDHTSAKCNYCTHRVDIGLEPACVNVCPEHAIISGDMDNPETEISRLLARETVSVRKPEKGTNPKLFYIDGDKASLDATAANPGTDYMWSSQSSGVGHYAKFAAEKAKVSSDKMTPQALYQIESNRKNDADKPRRVYDAPGKGVLWGWEVSAYVWTKAISAGAFLVPFLFFKLFLGSVPIAVKQVGAGVAIVFLTITGILLVKDLGRPERFLYTLLRPQWRSWLTRGSYIITVFGGILAAWWTAYFLEYNTALPVIEWLGIVPAVLTAVYTAFLFAQAKGRDFWQSPMLGLHMILHSLMAGASVFAIAGALLNGSSAWLGNLKYISVIFLVVSLVTLTIELWTTHTTEDAHKTVEMITNGRFSTAFWFGMVLIGNILPLMFLLLGPASAIGPAGALILVGLAFTEHVWVRAPQMIPLS